LNTYTSVARRHRAEGSSALPLPQARQKGRKKVAREKGIISDYPNLI